ncbi:hypothetical protein [Streptomyces marincola]|uniref:hypothetical protein n=1 Tax=Streptomyces marincola TaxID=2878388 RepID=UPI001C3F6B25|nr:hypothetical protein [Streptomyces marincola]
MARRCAEPLVGLVNSSDSHLVSIGGQGGGREDVRRARGATRGRRRNGTSLYFRPLMIATSTELIVAAATEYLYVLLAMPTGSYFTGGVRPVRVLLPEDQVRAPPGGTGEVKCACSHRS